MQCDFACQAIQIRPDHTFQRLLDGDLFNGERTDGKWESLGHNRIKAVSPRPDGTPKVIETTGEGNEFEVTVADRYGLIISNAQIRGISQGTPFNCSTGDQGSCRIPKADAFTVEYAYYAGEHTVHDRQATRFLVELSEEQVTWNVIDDVWIIRGNRLYWERDGKLEDSYSLRRLSKKDERKYFPPRLQYQTKPAFHRPASVANGDQPIKPRVQPARAKP